MRKYFRYDSAWRKGNNYYPINGALFVDLLKEYMYIIPNFPVSGGMVTQTSFELNLHRFTLWDDGLGLGNFTEQAYTVEHNWLVGFNSPDYSFIWKKYLEHKNNPIALFSSDNRNSLTPEIELADSFDHSWKTQTNIQLIQENSCSHIASLAQREDSFLASVLNICDKPSDFPFKPSEIVNLGGLDIDTERKVWNVGEKLGFWVYNNTGDNVIMYPVVQAYDKITSFELVAFRTNLEKATTELSILKASLYPYMGSYIGGAFLVFGFICVGSQFIKTYITAEKNPIYKV